MPWPNRFMAMAAPRAGRPTRRAAGSRTAPIRATAGEGQKKREEISIMIPMPQYAIAGVRRNRVSGDTIVSLMPVTPSTRLIATMMEIIMIVPINSLVA
ncbi:hypothetical protein D3C73_1413660 [compost metagenome]